MLILFIDVGINSFYKFSLKVMIYKYMYRSDATTIRSYVKKNEMGKQTPAFPTNDLQD
ncbi:MAG: hypothetical protein Q4Q55_05360 [Methanobrevibacter sp.]|nr:hypothetical protein [Methanobrevibacter sp.]